MEEHVERQPPKAINPNSLRYEEVLKAYEHLAVRVFIFIMALYGLIRAALR
jgi:hypothetical protein